MGERKTKLCNGRKQGKTTVNGSNVQRGGGQRGNQNRRGQGLGGMKPPQKKQKVGKKTAKKTAENQQGSAEIGFHKTEEG